MILRDAEETTDLSKSESVFESKSVQVFYPKLLADGRKKIPMQCVQHIFNKVFPEYQDSENKDVHLQEELRKLITLQLISYPHKVNEIGWPKTNGSVFPTYIAIITKVDTLCLIDPSKIDWVDELSFCKNTTRVRELVLALQINNFLKKRGQTMLPVPIKERSLQIFGDEKMLDGMVIDGWLFNGNLKLASIGAFELAKPITFQSSGVLGKPILAIENYHTYWSFCKWNARSKEYSAIVLGSGNNFQSDARPIDILMAEINADGIEYFGDLDAAGLSIPVAFNFRRNWEKQRAMPAKRFYEWLLFHGIRRIAKSVPTAKQRTELLPWLDSFVLESGMTQLFATNQWIPQENLGTEALHEEF